MRRSRPAAAIAIALLGLASAAAAPAAGAAGAATAPEGVYTLFKDGREHKIATVSRADGDFLLLADLLAALGGTMTEGPAGKTARIRLGGSELLIEAGAATTVVDGERRAVVRPALLHRGRLYVPPEFVTSLFAGALKRAVKWKDEATELLNPGDPGDERRAEPIEAEVEVRSLRDYTRVLFRFGGARVLPYTVNAPRGQIVLRIQADNVTARERAIAVGDGALERVAFEQSPGRGTFVLELGGDERDHQTAVLRDPFRVVIDIYRKSPYAGPAAPAVARATPPAPPVPAGRATPPAARATPENRPAAASTDLLRPDAAPAPAGEAGRGRGTFRTVVIDPGHGGSEPGARGPGDLLEKDVTLDIARRLGGALERNLGLRVVLTRTSDIDLPLDDRTGIANHEKADLFISIHANASLRKNARGAETYFLSRNATDDESRKLAALENAAVGEARGLEGTDLELILWNLAQNQYLKESQALAEIIQRELNQSLDVPNRGVKQAPFVVLVGTTMPAVLVEVGFITNPAEEKLLRDDSYKDRIVGSIYRSVLQFKQSRDLKMGTLAAERPALP